MGIPVRSLVMEGARCEMHRTVLVAYNLGPCAFLTGLNNKLPTSAALVVPSAGPGLLCNQ